MDASMESFRPPRLFSPEERYALTDQIRRSSRAVCAIPAEAWRKRRRRKHFFSKLTDATTYRQLDERHDAILAQLVHVIQHAARWAIRAP